MRKLSIVAVSLAGLFWLAGLVHSGDDKDKDLRAVVEKAIKAHGGAANIEKFKSMSMKGSGKYFGMGEGLPYTDEWASNGATQMRHTIDAGNFNMVTVLNGDKGWVKMGDKVVDMKEDEVAETKEALYAGHVGSLVPLVKEKDYKLATLGEVKVEKKPAIGIRVSKKGHRDINLFFDKDSSLLIKMEHMVKDLMGGGGEKNQETYFSEFKEFEGVKHPLKVDIKQDGKRFVEAEMSEYRVEKHDKSTFERP